MGSHWMQRTHITEYGYRSELGDHEIWAESQSALAQSMLGASKALKRCADDVANSDPAQGLPGHVFIRVRFGQFEPKTRDTIAKYKLVVRETFRSMVHG